MRYFMYFEPCENGETVEIIVSEEEIRKEYYPYWKDRIDQKYGKENSFSFWDCLEDWKTSHYAEEIGR